MSELHLLREIAQCAVYVRECQCLYFKQRNSDALQNAKSYERKLDKLLADYENMKNGRGNQQELPL